MGGGRSRYETACKSAARHGAIEIVLCFALKSARPRTCDVGACVWLSILWQPMPLGIAKERQGHESKGGMYEDVAAEDSEASGWYNRVHKSSFDAAHSLSTKIIT